MKIEKAYSERQMKAIVLRTIIITVVICCGIMGWILKRQSTKKEVYNESLVALELEQPDFEKVATDAEYAFMMYTEADYKWTKLLTTNDIIVTKQELYNVKTILDYHTAIVEKMPQEGNEKLIFELEEIDKIYAEYITKLEEDLKGLEERQEEIEMLKKEL